MSEKLTELLEKCFRRRLSVWTRFAGSFVGNADDAQDVVQESVKRTMIAKPPVGSELDLHKYIMSAIRTTAFKLLKARAQAVASEGLERREDPRPTALQQVIATEETKAAEKLDAAVRKRIEELPPEQKFLVEMLVLREPPLKYRVVAEKEGVAISTVHKRLRTILRKIAAELQASAPKPRKGGSK